MKKMIGVFIVVVWITIFYHLFNMIMPYVIIAFPTVLFPSIYILRKFQMKI